MKHLSLRKVVLCVLILLPSSFPADTAVAQAPTAAWEVEDGILRLLNSPETSVAVLDVRLSARRQAARDLIRHRNGPDGILGSSDDNPFDSLAEVESIPSVTAKDLERFAAFAKARGGYIDQGLRIKGTFFSGRQLRQALELVNNASEVGLVENLGIDPRSVSEILDRRPFPRLRRVARVPFVKRRHMRSIHAAADALDAADCAPDAPCAAGLSCAGRPAAGLQIGKCVDLGSAPAGTGSYCDASLPCGEGLICIGQETEGHGTCEPDWLWREFGDGTRRPIPDDSPFLDVPVLVYGLGDKPVDIVVNVRTRHPRPSDLWMILISPDGFPYPLWLGDEFLSDPPERYVLRGISPQANGPWTLRIVDQQPGEAGFLRLFSLAMTSAVDKGGETGGDGPVFGQ